MATRSRGFTLVELLIVIVVIGVVATLSIVAYNGAQDRARSAQTLTAVNQWLKALQMYKAKNGAFPNVNSCLGANYKYNYDGLGATGVGQCRQDNTVTGVTSSATFLAAMQPYITSNPTPAMVTTPVTVPTYWYRGAYYYLAGANSRIDFTLPKAAGGCPSTIGGTIDVISTVVGTNGNYMCAYIIGPTVGY
ncbi:MAG: prepilin-type N-terminal cleavage/methylation domain-containing protein [Candidatus Saccharimonas sp.]